MTSFAFHGGDRSVASFATRSLTPAAHRPLWAAPTFASVEHKQYVAMQYAYGSTGGVACVDEVAGLLRQRLEQPISTLARWIVARTIVSFEWQSRTLIPVFQFDLSDMSLRDGTVQVVRELSDVFDDWDLALWFAQPNSWLDDEAPADAIGHNQCGVLQAARADRFVARG